MVGNIHVKKFVVKKLSSWQATDKNILTPKILMSWYLNYSYPLKPLITTRRVTYSSFSSLCGTI